MEFDSPSSSLFSACRTCGERFVDSRMVRVTPAECPRCKNLVEEPIRAVEEMPMPKAKPATPVANGSKEVAKPTAPARLPVTPEAVHQVAAEYLAFRAEIERVQCAMEKHKAFLKEQLPALGNEIEVEGQVVYLCPTESKSFDLASAKETLADRELAKLKPFIRVTETFELKAAEQVGFELSKFRKFISVKESVQLRVKERKGE